MADVFICDAVRTPRGKGKKDGVLHEVTALKLAETVLRAIVERNGIDTKKIEDVVFGCVTAIGEQGADIARSAVLAAGYDQSVPGMTVNRFCASGLQSIVDGYARIACGAENLIVAGGVESMSRVPMSSDGGAIAADYSVAGKHGVIPQGVAADLIATLNDFTREKADQFAQRSHLRAAKAVAGKRFQKSIIPVKDVNGFMIADQDETIRSDCTLEGLAALAPAFEAIGKNFGFNEVAKLKYPQIERIRHIHTAGNSSAIADGASAVLLASAKMSKALKLKRRAKIRAYAMTGSEPTIMLTGPLSAVEKVLTQAKMQAKDIDLWEINEAFASIPAMVIKNFGLSEDCVNVAGGSIALGHPLGATGAMLIGTVIDELELRNLQIGLVTLCVAGGMGAAMIVERV